MWVSWRTLKEIQFIACCNASKLLPFLLQFLDIFKLHQSVFLTDPSYAPQTHLLLTQPSPKGPLLTSFSSPTYSLSKPTSSFLEVYFKKAQEYSGKHLPFAYEGKGEPKLFFFFCCIWVNNIILHLTFSLKYQLLFHLRNIAKLRSTFELPTTPLPSLNSPRNNTSI